MKKRRAFILIFLSYFIIFFSVSCKDGYRKYIKLLQQTHRGMTPYWIPNPSDGPGAILEEVNGAEQLVYDKESAFPSLEMDIGSVAAVYIENASKIKIKGDVEATISKILNTDIEASLKFSLTKDTTMSFSVIDPELHRIGTGIIDETLKDFDLNNVRHKNIIKKLMQPNVRLICGTIHVKGFKFIFENASNLESAESAKLPTALANQNLSFSRTSNTEFCLEAKSPQYIAYYAHKWIEQELQTLYDDLKRAQEARAENNEVDQIESQTPSIKADINSLPQFKADLERINKNLEGHRNEEARAESRMKTASSEANRKQLQSQLAAIATQIKNEQRRQKSLDARIQSIERYKSLKERVPKNNDDLKRIAEKRYKLLDEEEVVIPKKIEEIVKKAP
jgi:hypothetical protein